MSLVKCLARRLSKWLVVGLGFQDVVWPVQNISIITIIAVMTVYINYEHCFLIVAIKITTMTFFRKAQCIGGGGGDF